MAFMYFDESIHAAAGFIVGAWAVWQEDPTSRIDAGLKDAGLRPGLEEFKSGARMTGNEAMIRARGALHDVLRNSRIGVVVVPSKCRSNLGQEAVRGLHKILSTSDLGISGHDVFFDQGLISDRRPFDELVQDLGLAGCHMHVEQNSVTVLGLQAADLVAHTCATMLLSQMGFVTKRVKAGEYSGYEPDDDIDLGFLLWASLRWNFFAAPPPPFAKGEEPSFEADVASRGLFVANTASDDLRSAAHARFGTMYLGCIH